MRGLEIICSIDTVIRVFFFKLVSHIMLVSVQIVFASYKLTQNPLIGLLSYPVLPYSFQK